MMKTRCRQALLLVLCLGLLVACAAKPEVEREENYAELFPFGGISKPEHSLEDMAHLPCDPQMALSAYKYPGVTLPEADALEYIVTLRCLYTLPDDATSANYVVRYIDANKAIRQVRSDVSQSDGAEQMTAGAEFERTWRVRSGYPLYLSVSGVAPRGSNIRASITARSVDGLVVVPTLISEQAQNKVGPNPIPAPYCEYIILP